jgi:6-pyruvoyltetrahydropterin/6-carboxytetrahydropterin synthase
MPTSVVRSFRFEAAHQLPWHPGKCRQLHGHGYRLEVTVTGPLTAEGIVIDFADLSSVVRSSVLDVYDHTYLNDLIDNPTAELIADDAWKRLSAAGVAVTRLRLWETEDCSVEITA